MQQAESSINKQFIDSAVFLLHATGRIINQQAVGHFISDIQANV
jgi:hypothetical protein